ncbi:hypothetical protein OD350_28190 [Clostridium beijerinckii]|uniref:hypothetical protein n=1 Tax=Clostridium beijerinckii TaxID=1520 RepID=UPI0022276B53|nr:hypothetical protein [Clostridium beijerinckii]UYZ36008.1 hypothetical protein OD350_28190 [Clostridium beijerinckii]
MNSTQKKFKKEMEKGLKNLKKKNEQAYYNYITANNLDNPEQRIKREKKERIKSIYKKIASFITTIIIIGIATYFIYNKSSNINTLANNIQIDKSNTQPENMKEQNKQKEIINYINTVKPYMENISAEIEKKNNEVKQINSKNLSQTEYIKDIQSHNEIVKNNLTNIENTKAPDELNNYANQIKEGYELLCNGYENESIYFKTNNQKYKQSADENYKSSNDKLSGGNKELIKILDENNIKHK